MTTEARSPEDELAEQPAIEWLEELGWEFVHVCVDDATRLAYVEVLPDEKAVTAIGFLRRALAPGRSVWATVLLRRVAVPGLARGTPRKRETTLATSVA